MWCMQWTHRQTQMQLISAFRCYNGAVRLLCPCRVYAWLISNACLVLTESCVTNCVCNLFIHQSQSCKPVLSPFWIGRVFVSSTEEPFVQMTNIPPGTEASNSHTTIQEVLYCTAGILLLKVNLRQLCVNVIDRHTLSLLRLFAPRLRFTTMLTLCGGVTNISLMKY